MVLYEQRFEVAADAGRVWALLSAVESWPRWLPTVTRVDALDGSPLSVGKRYRVEQPSLRPAEWKVSEVDAGRRFEWRARSPGMEMVADHVVEPLPDNAAKVHLSFGFKGPLGALLGRAFGRITRHYLEQEADALKRQAEAG